MSLVAYGSSDESSEDEGNNCDINTTNEAVVTTAAKQTNEKICLPAPKYSSDIANQNDRNDEPIRADDSSEKINFCKLPKPKSTSNEPINIVEEDDIPPIKNVVLKSEKPAKRDRGPIKITVPSLSEFKDVEEENEARRNRITQSSKGTQLFALLPPPKGSAMKNNTLIPHVLNKTSAKATTIKVIKPPTSEGLNSTKAPKPVPSKNSMGLLSYDSNSEDEDETSVNSAGSSTTDFFALTTESVSNIPVPELLNSDIKAQHDTKDVDSAINVNVHDNNVYDYPIDNSSVTTENSSQKMLVSNVINLPREEILLKNKAEVGPKLPVPEQEYNIDTEGNVAFDEKAIEYLCGKRGIKRKNKELDEANIIEINAEDIKPDEREWLVKALTEQTPQRPVSMQGGGVNSQSKKKHQITYLAHQAKAMEMELKNQWAQNRMTKKQTQSKYGF